MSFIIGSILIVIGVISLVNPRGLEEWRYKMRSRLTKPSDEEQGLFAKLSSILLIAFGIFTCIIGFI